jgi:cysteine synthase A
MFPTVDQLIGNTPIVKLDLPNIPSNVTLLAKVEKFNIGGSVKDRVARQMIIDAEEAKILLPGGTIVEATSGNTGIALALLGAARGYHVILTMPPSVSVERRALLKAYGADLVLTDGGMAGAVAKAKEIAESTTGSFYASQFDNKSNPKAHELTTGPEIAKEMKDKHVDLDYFVAGVGTGGTISGAGKFLKENLNKDLKVIAVEPAKSPILTKGIAAAHGIQGIGANFVPANLDRSVVDDYVTVTDEDSFSMMHLLAKNGLHVGISSGAAVQASLQLAARFQDETKHISILTILPDTGERYLSLAKE